MTLDTVGTVMVSVSYWQDCLESEPQPVNFGSMGANGCRNSLNALVGNCSIPPNMRKNWAANDYIVGGTVWSGCMEYTMVGVKAANKPEIVWYTSTPGN